MEHICEVEEIAQNQTSGGARDDGTKFIWYDAIDKILNLNIKANGVPSGMDQGVLVPGTGIRDTPKDLSKGHEEGGEPSSPPPSWTGIEHESIGSSPRIRATNLIECRGKGTSSKLA